MTAVDSRARATRTARPPRVRGADVGPSRWARWVILSIAVVYLATPLVALVGFTVRGGLSGGTTAEHWTGLLTGDLGAAAKPLATGLQNSLLLALVTVGVMLALLVPTMVLVRLHLPGGRSSSSSCACYR